MYFQADAGPFTFRTRADGGDAFLLTDQRKGVTQTLFSRRLELVAVGIEARTETVEEPRQVALTAPRRGP
jgi:hypothetical protein